MKNIWSPYLDGIRQSDLQRWMVCRERFRIYKLDRLVEKKQFNPKMDYGTFIHEAIAAYIQYDGTKRNKMRSAEVAMDFFYDFCLRCYGDSAELNTAAAMAPIHFEQYTNVYDLTKRKYTAVEKPFKIPYRLPDERLVYLTGTIDYAFKAKYARSGTAVVIGDHKVKGQYDVLDTSDQLYEDLQLMIYTIAYNKLHDEKATKLEYDVIRRPGSHPRSPRPRKSENEVQFIERLMQFCLDNQEEHYLRILVDIDFDRVKKFEEEVLAPMLMDFCDWYETVEHEQVFNKHNYRRPMGVYDPMTALQKSAYYRYVVFGDASDLCDASVYPEYEKGQV